MDSSRPQLPLQPGPTAPMQQQQQQAYNHSRWDGMPPSYTPTAPVGETTLLIPTVVSASPTPSLSGVFAVSCVVFWCCNPLFGAIAFFVAMFAGKARDGSRYQEAKKLRTVSLGLSIAGVIVSVVIVLAIALPLCLKNEGCSVSFK